MMLMLMIRMGQGIIQDDIGDDDELLPNLDTQDETS